MNKHKEIFDKTLYSMIYISICMRVICIA